VSYTGTGESRRYLIDGLSEADQRQLVTSLALVAERTNAPDAAVRALRKPRIGVYEPWTGSMDAGWTRWVLEQYGFSFVTLHPEDFHSPLSSKVDVVVIASDARVPVEGGGRGGRAADREVRPEYAYALTADDLKGFEAFVRAGGTVVCLNNASSFAIQQFKLPVTNVVAGLRAEEFFLRGSIVGVTTNPTHPITAGLPETAAVFDDSSPVFDTHEGFAGTVLARYADTGSPLLSGYLIGETHLQGKAAALDVQLDQGHVILLGFRPQFRGQSFGTFKVLFNAVIQPREK
jgi:hypothetical protein